MGKRRPVVVISSSSEDEVRGGSASADRAYSRSRSRSAASKRPRGGRSQKPGGCSVAPLRDASRYAEPADFDMLSGEFSECLHYFSPVSGVRCTERKELWADKHKPRCLAELAVHKKKAEEVRKWLEERVKLPKDGSDKCALLITGQAGVGKSAAIHVIASHLGAELCEWTTPTPTLWDEHLHNTNSGIRYISKLDEFESFVEKIRKYCLLHQSCTGGSEKPIIFLIDDIPITNGRVAFARLSKCLTTLVHLTKAPTVILITEYHRNETGSSSTHYLEELEATLERAGACKVAFNPITVNSIKKTLWRICEEEKCDMTPELIDNIAKACGGDIRHAITSLQYCCLKRDRSSLLSISTQHATDSKVNHGKTGPLPSSSCSAGYESNTDLVPFSFGRDENLSLFHALGKFLHNKREMLDPPIPGSNSFTLHERFARNPLKMDAPEKILSQAHGQARPITDFLHENVLDFIHDDAIDDVWLVASYLSGVDCLLSGSSFTRQRMISSTYESENVIQAIAASVAVRGVLFGNSHPSPSRWHSIRSPQLWQIEQSSRQNKNQILLERSETHGSSSSCHMSQIATEYRPIMKWLGSRASFVDSDLVNLDNFERKDSSGESEEDDIEDW